MKHLICSLLVSLLLVPLLFSQTRAIRPVNIQIPNEGKVQLYEGSYALVIGVSDYQNNAWVDLDSVPADVDAVRKTLERQGFIVQTVMNPTESMLRDHFEEFIDDYGYEPENRLLFYYAGHGHTQERKGRQFGYLVPADAPDPYSNERTFSKKALKMEQIRSWARQIESKHALFVFDSCFSGSVFQSRAALIPEDISFSTTKPVRQFIAAGTANQTVPSESVFRPLFIRGISGKADYDMDGYVTGVELGMYLQKQVPYYESGQTPQYGKIRDPYLDAGNFVFVVNRREIKPKGKPTSPSFTSSDRNEKSRPQIKLFSVNKTVQTPYGSLPIGEIELLSSKIFSNAPTSDINDAIKFYQELLESRNLSINLQKEIIYRLSYLALSAGSLKQALNYCSQLTGDLSSSTRFHQCYFWIAALEDPKRSKNGRRAIDLVLQKVPVVAGREEEKALIRTGLSMLNEDWLEAQKEAKTLVDAEPPSRYQVRAWQWLVAIYRGLELPEEALRELNALLKAHPEALSKDLLIEQVLLLRDLNRREEALQVLLSHPKILDLEMQQLQLSLLWELRLWEGVLEIALQMLPQMSNLTDRAELHFRRGQAYEQIKNPLKALPAYERSLQNVLNPTWGIEAKLAILRLYYWLKDVRFTERSEIYLTDTRFKPEQEEQIRNWLVERYEYVGEPTRTIPHRQGLIRLWEDRLRNNLEPDQAAREQRMLRIGKEHLNLGRLGASGAWEQAESWSAQLRRSENPLIQLEALLLGGEAAAALKAHERSVAAYLQLTYFHAEGLNENQKFAAWQQMGLSYETLGRINDAKAIYSKIKYELSDPRMKQAASNKLKRLEVGEFRLENYQPKEKIRAFIKPSISSKEKIRAFIKPSISIFALGDLKSTSSKKTAKSCGLPSSLSERKQFAFAEKMIGDGLLTSARDYLQCYRASKPQSKFRFVAMKLEGEVLLIMGESYWPQAQILFEDWLLKNPNDAAADFARFQLGKIHFRYDRPQVAEETLSSIPSSSSLYGPARSLMGQALFQRMLRYQEKNASVQANDLASRIVKYHKEALLHSLTEKESQISNYQIGFALDISGDSKNALPYYERWIELANPSEEKKEIQKRVRAIRKKLN